MGEGDQHIRGGPAEQSSLGATGRDFAGDRNLRELSLVLTCPLPALISSPFGGVIDVASVCFSLRGGRVISSGVFDVVDVADADLEMNSCDVDIGAQAAVRSELVTGLSAVPLGMAGHHAGLGVTSCVGPCVGSQPDHRRGRL